jgi:hypothetical protein
LFLIPQEGIRRLGMDGEWVSRGAGAVVFFEKAVFANRVSVGEEEVKYIKFGSVIATPVHNVPCLTSSLTHT